MAEEITPTTSVSKEGIMTKVATGALVHVMGVIAVMVIGCIVFCECFMCIWHMHQQDYNYAVPNEMWLLATGIVGYLFGNKKPEQAAKLT